MGDIVRVIKKGKFVGWYVRFKDVDGRRKQRASHQPSKAEARRLLIEIEARVARGVVGIPEPERRETMSLSELCERFLSEFSPAKIKDLESYRRTTRVALKRLLPQLGSIEISALNQAEVERALRIAAQRYQVNSVRSAAQKLQVVLGWAVKQRIATRNVASGVELPQRESSIEHLSPDEASRLLTELRRRANGPRRPLAWRSRLIGALLALQLGLRRGEVFGLRWQDVDLDRARLTVARSYRTLPKSNKPRHLPVPAALVQDLREWQGVCPATPESLVCPVYYDGSWRMSSSRATHGLLEALQASSCRPLTRGWHSLRHTMASTYVSAGGSILALQKILGHTSVNQTMIYAHLAPDYLAQEMERVKY